MKVRIRKEPFDGFWHTWVVETKSLFFWDYKRSFRGYHSEEGSSEIAKADALKYASELANPTIINLNWKEIK